MADDQRGVAESTEEAERREAAAEQVRQAARNNGVRKLNQRKAPSHRPAPGAHRTTPKP